MAEDLRIKVRRKRKKEDVQIKKLIVAPCEANIKTVAEEHLPSENV